MQGKKKYTKPVTFTYFSLTRNPKDDSLHFIARYNKRYVGGKLVKQPHNDGYHAGKFKLIRKFWPNLCSLIDYYDTTLINTEYLDSGPTKSVKNITDEHFGIMLEELKKRQEAEVNYWLELFGEQDG